MIGDVAQIGQEVRVLRRVAVRVTAGDLRITVVRGVAVRGTLVDRRGSDRAGRTRGLAPSVTRVDVVGLA